MNATIPSFLAIEFRNGRWKTKFLNQRKLLEQIRDEAGIKHKPHPDDMNEDYEKILTAASAHGIGIETEGDES